MQENRLPFLSRDSPKSGGTKMENLLKNFDKDPNL